MIGKRKKRWQEIITSFCIHYMRPVRSPARVTYNDTGYYVEDMITRFADGPGKPDEEANTNNRTGKHQEVEVYKRVNYRDHGIKPANADGYEKCHYHGDGPVQGIELVGGDILIAGGLVHRI